MPPPNTATHELVRWLIARESKGETVRAQAAFRVYGKLHQLLLVMIGARGVRSLILRALTLAMRDVPGVEIVDVRDDGSLEFPEGTELPEGFDKATNGGELILKELLDLLITFVGDTLTLHLVRDIWPDAPFRSIGSMTEEDQ